MDELLIIAAISIFVIGSGQMLEYILGPEPSITLHGIAFILLEKMISAQNNDRKVNDD